MKRYGLLLSLLIVVTFLCDCGGGGGGGGGGGNLTISVSTQNNQTTLDAGQTLTVASDVMHAGGNPSVTWTISGATCPNNCGSLNSNANSTTYAAPLFVGKTFQITVTATADADMSKSASIVLTVDKSLSADCPSGDEGVLNGQFAFLLRAGGSSGSSVVIGSFTTDGKGNITAGLEDVNQSSSGPQTGLSIVSAQSLYSVGQDHRGCLGVVNSQGGINLYRFALGGIAGGVATLGRIIEFDDTTGMGTRAEGYLAEQDPGSFATGGIRGNYAFGMGGPNSSNTSMVVAGVINANAGAFASGNLDSDNGGTPSSDVTGVSGSYSVMPDGRGTMALSIGGGSNFVLYMVSTSKFLVISTDMLSAAHPLQSGQFIEQTLNSFDNLSLGAAAVVYASAYDSANSASVATVGSITPDGAGNATVVLDTNDAGTFTPMQTSIITYAVGANGRVTFTSGFGMHPPVLYLVGPNQGFLVGSDLEGTSGFFDPQTGGPFANASLSGAYAYGTEGTQVGGRLTAVGSITFDGTNTQSTEDDSTPTGLMADISISVSQYSFLSTASPPGRGSLDMTGKTVAYIISPTKMVYINTPAMKPRVVIVEK